jgi:hypothetical protein
MKVAKNEFPKLAFKDSAIQGCQMVEFNGRIPIL